MTSSPTVVNPPLPATDPEPVVLAFRRASTEGGTALDCRVDSRRWPRDDVPLDQLQKWLDMSG